MEPATSLPVDRLRALVPPAVVGSMCIVAGGVVAAITAPLGLAHGSWMAAYLVLAAGVAQVVLGAGQALLAPRPPSRALLAWELTGWNVGGAGVIAGTLVGAPMLTTAAGAILTLTLALFVLGVRGSGSATRSVLWLYRLVLLILLVSVPIGVVMAWQRHT